jgi:hypothetical protein
VRRYPHEVARVRHIRPNDVALLRVRRLRALETDPLAFGSTFERELAYRDDGRREPLPHSPAVTMVGMSRPLRSS